MPFPFPDPSVTSEFESENGIIYSWDGEKWVVKNFTDSAQIVTASEANADYVRQDGTSTMSGDLKFSGNHSVKSDSDIKINGAAATKLAQAGTDCVIIDGSFTTFRNRDVYFLQDVVISAPATFSNTSVFTGAVDIQGALTTKGILSTGPSAIQAGFAVTTPGSTSSPILKIVALTTSESSKAEYFGSINTAASIATKKYVDDNSFSWVFPIKNAAATATSFEEFQALIAAL